MTKEPLPAGTLVRLNEAGHGAVNVSVHGMLWVIAGLAKRRDITDDWWALYRCKSLASGHITNLFNDEIEEG